MEHLRPGAVRLADSALADPPDAAWVALVVAVASAVAIVALSTFGLQWAHTYRQWSMEGLGFVHVGMGLFIASAGAFFCVGVLLWARARTSRRWERVYSEGVLPECRDHSRKLTPGLGWPGAHLRFP